MTATLQIIFDALSLGSLYALGALGIALIFGVMRLVNFAHGDYIAFCVFALLWPSTDAAAIVFAGHLPAWLLIPLVLAIGAGISVLSEILVFRRFRNVNPATMMIASFALGFVIKYFLLMLYSSRPKSINLWSNLSLPVEILGAGIPLLEAFEILADQTKDTNKGFGAGLQEVADLVRGGTELSEALNKFPRIFPDIYVNMIKAGEAGGALEVILRRLADFMEKAEALKRKVKGAMVYPVVVVMVAWRVGLLVPSTSQSMNMGWALLMIIICPRWAAPGLACQSWTRDLIFQVVVGDWPGTAV